MGKVSQRANMVEIHPDTDRHEGRVPQHVAGESPPARVTDDRQVVFVHGRTIAEIQACKVRADAAEAKSAR